MLEYAKTIKLVIKLSKYYIFLFKILIGINFFRSIIFWFRLMYSHGLVSNSGPLVKLEKIYVISPKPPVVLVL